MPTTPAKDRTGRRVGYARVSTADQVLERQVDELTAAGCVIVHTDTVSGVKDDRPGLAAAIHGLCPGDTLVVTRLDRLGRSTLGLAKLSEQLRLVDVHLHCLNLGFDTSTAHGRMFFGLMATFAQWERELIVERTMSGLAAARRRGRVGGRPPVTADNPKVKAVSDLLEAGHSIRQAAIVAGVGESTARRYAIVARSSDPPTS